MQLTEGIRFRVFEGTRPLLSRRLVFHFVVVDCFLFLLFVYLFSLASSSFFVFVFVLFCFVFSVTNNCFLVCSSFSGVLFVFCAAGKHRELDGDIRYRE